MDEIKNIIEALLFVAGDPLSIDRIKNVLELTETKEIRKAIASLAEEYEDRSGGFFLCEVAGGYQIRTRSEYKMWIKRFLRSKPIRISRAGMETLAIVAYKQPVIRNEIEHIRGVDCGGILRMLLERNLIRILGRKKIPGRPLIYATTKQFLEMFNLKDLKELPSTKEIETFETLSTESTGQAQQIESMISDDEKGKNT